MQPGKLVRDIVAYSVIAWASGLIGYCTAAQHVSPPDPREWLSAARTSLYTELAMQRGAYGRNGRWSTTTRAGGGPVTVAIALDGEVLVLTSRHRKVRGVTCELRYAPRSRLGAIPSFPVRAMPQRPTDFPVDGRPYCYHGA